jgi:hypothetical protein
MTTDSSGALRLFYSYAQQDELWRQRLETSLATLRQQGYIAGWHQQEISAGAEWEWEISTHLNEAHIILLLISPDFVASDYCYSNQILRAMEQNTQCVNQKIPALQIWTDPYRRNPFFTGREDLLTRLHDRLTQTRAAVLTQPQAISGLGGIGKTQTAVEYAYRFVLWVSAATRETLLAGFVTLADLLSR